MCKFWYFCINQILREIKLAILEVQNMPFSHILRLWILIFMIFCTFGKLNSTKLTKFRAPKMVDWVFSVFEKGKNSRITKFSASKCVKIAAFEALDSQTLISRHFWDCSNTNLHIFREINNQKLLCERLEKLLREIKSTVNLSNLMPFLEDFHF